MPPRIQIEPFSRFMAVHDAEFVVVAVSDDLAALVGRTPDELVGSPGQAMAVGGLRARIRRELAATGTVRDVAMVRTGPSSQVAFAYTTRRVGDLYVTSGEVVPASAQVIRKRELERGRPPAPAGGPWLTKAEACRYTRRSARTLERAVKAGELEAGGTRGRRSFQRVALDVWLARGGLLVLIVLALLAGVELVDLLVSPGDWGVPPGTGHPLEGLDDVLALLAAY